MKILHVAQYSLPEVCSGYTLRTQAIARAQKALGLDPTIVTSPRHPAVQPLELDGVQHFRCSPEGPSRGVWLRDARRVAVLAEKIVEIAGQLGAVDVLHAHSPMLCGLAALRAARRLRLPVVYEVRGLWEEAMVERSPVRRLGLRYMLARAAEGRVCRQADAVVTISAGLQDDLDKRGIPRNKIYVVPNGVDTDGFTPRPEAVGWRARYGIAQGPVVLYLGAIRAYEGIDTLLQAFPSIRVRLPSSQLLIVGAGEDRDRIASLAARLGDDIAVLPPVPHDAVQDFYAAADVVVYPRLSTRATELVTPLKPMEAMAMAKAIVASDVGGLREILSDGVTARLVAPGSPDALAGAVQGLLGDEGERRRLGQTARRTVLDRFDWTIVARRYVELYRGLSRLPAER
jgi:PEP-CTERM/exosortase A-associated glycosyltransferase